MCLLDQTTSANTNIVTMYVFMFKIVFISEELSGA